MQDKSFKDCLALVISVWGVPSTRNG